MRRILTTIVLEILLTALLALILLTAWESVVAGGDVATGLGSAARLLFFFTDIAFYAWIPLLVVVALRGRRLPGAAATLLLALIGAVLNVLVVIVIGLVQTGGLAGFVLMSVEGGVALLVAAVVVVPLLQLRLRARGGAPQQATGRPQPRAAGGGAARLP